MYACVCACGVVVGVGVEPPNATSGHSDKWPNGGAHE